MNIRRAILTAKYNLGMVSRDELIADHLDEREYILQNLPLEHREQIRGIVSQMQNLQTISDVPQFYNLMGELHRRFDAVHSDIQKGSSTAPDGVRKAVDFIAGSNVFGYQPQGARAYKMFVNPMMIPGFFYESYWPFASAVRKIITAIMNDSIRVVPKPGVSQKRHKEVLQILRDLKIVEYRKNKMRYRLVYGNDWTEVQTNFSTREKDRLVLKIPDRMWPVIDPATLKVTGWTYQEGYGYTYYPLGKLYHGKDSSLRYPEIGLPRTHGLFMDMEADISASSFNLNVFHRGGLIGFIVAMEDPGTSQLTHQNVQKTKAILREEIRTQYSGAKAGLSILVSNYVKNVHRLTNMNTLDAAYPNLRYSVARMLGVIMDLPSGMLGSSEKSEGVYSSGSLQEQAIYMMVEAARAFTAECDSEINEMLAREFGIDDHYIKQHRRTNVFTLAAAQALNQITKSGAIINTNQALELLDMEPLPPDNPRGRVVLDNSLNREPEKKPLQAESASRSESLLYSVFDVRTNSFYPGFGGNEEQLCQEL